MELYWNFSCFEMSKPEADLEVSILKETIIRKGGKYIQLFSFCAALCAYAPSKPSFLLLCIVPGGDFEGAVENMGKIRRIKKAKPLGDFGEG